MSCSITSTEQPVLLAHPEQQRAERLGLLLGDAAGRLVEHEHLRVLGEDAGQVDDAPAAGGQLAGELLRKAPRPMSSMSSSTLAATASSLS